MSKEEIIDSIISYLPKYGVIKAAIFGSFAKNTSNSESDIDLLVDFEKGKSLFDLIGLKQDLEEKISKKIDIVTFNSIHPHIKQSILNEMHVFYERS